MDKGTKDVYVRHTENWGLQCVIFCNIIILIIIIITVITIVIIITIRNAQNIIDDYIKAPILGPYVRP